MQDLYNPDQIIGNAAKTAAKELFGSDLSENQIQVQKTRKEFAGDATMVVFPLTKMSGKSPEQTGQLIGEYLVKNVSEISDFNVVKGFLNLSFSQDFWLRFLKNALENARFGFGAPDSLPRVIVEYSSPNTNKPLHLGHCRNIFLGYSVSEILKAAGHKVTKVQIINDRGIHICKSMLAWQRFGNGETPESSGIKGDKLVGKYYVLFETELKAQAAVYIAEGLEEDTARAKTEIMLAAQELLRKWEARDPDVYELWSMMNGWVYKGFDETYKSMGVDFDKLYYESDTYLLGKAEVEEGLAKGVFYRKEDSSIWVDLTAEGLDQKALLRKDGTAMYITQDIGTAILRFKDFPDTDYQIYTVGNEQEYHFKVLFLILKKLGFRQAEKCYHLSYGMVELPEGKMKSREGTVVDADDLMSEMIRVAQEVSEEQGKLDGVDEDDRKQLYRTIGMSALKYFLLRVDPRKNMLFNPKESIDFNGHTGPFIQYTYVRTLAVLRKAAERGIDVSFGEVFNSVELSRQELDVIKKIQEWPATLNQAATSYDPSLVANYAHELAREFNGFYQSHQIIREENAGQQNFRFALTRKTGEVLKNAMSLLGIVMPERM